MPGTRCTPAKNNKSRRNENLIVICCYYRLFICLSVRSIVLRIFFPFVVDNVQMSRYVARPNGARGIAWAPQRIHYRQTVSRYLWHATRDKRQQQLRPNAARSFCARVREYDAQQVAMLADKPTKPIRYANSRQREAILFCVSHAICTRYINKIRSLGSVSWWIPSWMEV